MIRSLPEPAPTLLVELPPPLAALHQLAFEWAAVEREAGAAEERRDHQATDDLRKVAEAARARFISAAIRNGGEELAGAVVQLHRRLAELAQTHTLMPNELRPGGPG